MLPINLKLITGPIGARMDFVAGWLGTLPGWINNQWHIDPVTGQSNGFMRMTKYLDWGCRDLVTLLQDQQFTLSQNPDYKWAGACHGYDLQPDNVVPHILNGTLEILQIVVDQDQTNEIFWNFVVKTFLTPDLHAGHLRNNSPWSVDKEIVSATDTNRIHRVDQILREPMYLRTLPDSIPSNKINYREIASSKGSLCLEKLFDLQVPNGCHQLWQKMLPLSFSPSTITVWGHEWRQADYFDQANSYAVQQVLHS